LSDEESEEVAFFAGGKTVEDVCVFADLKVGEESAALPRLGEAAVAGEGNENVVTDAIGVEGYVGGEAFLEKAFDECDHAQRTRMSAFVSSGMFSEATFTRTV
jgi:hypothetical protein